MHGMHIYLYTCRKLTRRKHQFPRKRWDMREEQMLKVSRRVQMAVNLLPESSKTALIPDNMSSQEMSSGWRTVLQERKRLQSW